MKKKLSLQHSLHTLLKAIPLLSLFLANIISLEFGSWQLPLYPFVGLALYFHWMLYRPDCLPPIPLAIVAFVSGIAISDTSSFILPFIYLGLYPVFLRFRHRLFGQKFSKIWMAFTLFSFITTAFYWIAKALVEKDYFLYTNLNISALIIVMAYPLITLFNSNLQRLIPLR